jgi:hypothetical protein
MTVGRFASDLLAFTTAGPSAQSKEYDGDHTNRRAERVETRVLPFFSRLLPFDAAPAAASR